MRSTITDTGLPDTATPRKASAKFEIQHTTIQFETGDHNCDLAPESKV